MVFAAGNSQIHKYYQEVSLLSALAPGTISELQEGVCWLEQVNHGYRQVKPQCTKTVLCVSASIIQIKGHLR